MWGINPLAVGKIITGVGVSSLLLGKHGALKHLSSKIKIHVSEQHAEAARSMARSIARQDRLLYEELRKQLELELAPEEYRYIFEDSIDMPGC